ncbi:uncharacterized protein LOC131026814 isoform X5 [Cryptomeria japonica]|uniref:uncharacterized protein LOC131026814 isoform X5 n=1 Tax=Cryptomeria japonica TaxID=3369 RepID=UPI0027DA96EE|nr:uncharacterized protein LOC131026814 isoform X5 [Cryptomeria japonica]
MWGRIAGGGFRGCISSPSNNFKLFIKFNLFSTASMSMHAEAEDLHSAKRSKLNNNDNTKKVGTHNGSFHCDEALACYMIRLTNKFRDAHIVRTRDSKVLDTLDAVLDVGGVYDPEKDCYDHHQKGFDHDFGHGFKTKLSSAGLVYKHYGREIVAKELGLNPDHSDVESVYIALYKGFMEEIDAVDNGINQYDTEKPARYIRNTHLSARISRINPDWMEENTADKEDHLFHCAMMVAGKDFEEDDRSLAWRVQAVAVAPGQFDSRKPLPLGWRGLRDDELTEVAGIDGCVFVHSSGFIGGNKTMDGALEMARKSLRIQ